jgi:hypothetical protein
MAQINVSPGLHLHIVWWVVVAVALGRLAFSVVYRWDLKRTEGRVNPPIQPEALGSLAGREYISHLWVVGQFGSSAGLGHFE